MIKAIDAIIAANKKQQAAYDTALVKWERERKQRWLTDERPKFAAMQKLVASKARGEVITHAETLAIFGESRYNGLNNCGFHEKVDPPGTLQMLNGSKVSRPTGLNIPHLEAMKELLNAIEDDVVNDTSLAKLGVKDVGPIFRMAAEMGGLVS
jgi:hypothetical protein